MENLHIENTVKNEGNVHYEEIGNTTFKVVSYYSTEGRYEDIVKSALLREIEKNR